MASFKQLFMTKHKDEWYVSMGKLAFWLVLTPAIIIWGQNVWLDSQIPVRDISPNHIQMILILTAYNLGKRITSVVGIAMGKNKEDI